MSGGAPRRGSGGGGKGSAAASGSNKVATKKDGELDSFDYSWAMSPIMLGHFSSLSRSDHVTNAVVRWGLLFLIGVVVALVCVTVISLTRLLQRAKFGVVYALIDAERREGGLATGAAFGASIGFALLYALLATLPVWLEPAAGGSGVAEVKLILNGLKLPHVLRLRTLACRVTGVIFSVASGLPVGYEGPAISIGASIGAGLSQGKSSTLGIDTRSTVLQSCRNDKSKRDFIAVGASAGIAAAFSAPLGGTLYALEEATSHWHRSLTWHVFFAAMTATAVIDFMLSGLSSSTTESGANGGAGGGGGGSGGAGWGILKADAMMNFGSWTSSGQSSLAWGVWELPAFIGLGCVGGLVGAAFNAANAAISRVRMRRPRDAVGTRVAEVAVVAVLAATVAFVSSVTLGSCVALPPTGSSAPLVTLYCPQGEFNPLASLWMAPSEESIRFLFHYASPNATAAAPGGGGNNASLAAAFSGGGHGGGYGGGYGGGVADPPVATAAFTPLTLAVFFVSFTSLMCLAAGIAVPAGLFIPTLLSGASLGRLVGLCINLYAPASWHVDEGTYSLIGAAAMLGGITRMSVSLAAILLECTGDVAFGLPIMAALISARLCGNLLGDGIYETQIRLRRWPLLPDTVDKDLGYTLRAADVMTAPPLVFREVETAGRVHDVLTSTTHNGFPVVWSEAMMAAHPRVGSLAGIISRRHLAAVLAARAFHAAPPRPASVPAAASPPPALRGEQLALGGGEDEDDAEGGGGGGKPLSGAGASTSSLVSLGGAGSGGRESFASGSRSYDVERGVGEGEGGEDGGAAGGRGSFSGGIGNGGALASGALSVAPRGAANSTAGTGGYRSPHPAHRKGSDAGRRRPGVRLRPPSVGGAHELALPSDLVEDGGVSVRRVSSAGLLSGAERRPQVPSPLRRQATGAAGAASRADGTDGQLRSELNELLSGSGSLSGGLPRPARATATSGAPPRRQAGGGPPSSGGSGSGNGGGGGRDYHEDASLEAALESARTGLGVGVYQPVHVHARSTSTNSGPSAGGGSSAGRWLQNAASGLLPPAAGSAAAPSGAAAPLPRRALSPWRLGSGEAGDSASAPLLAGAGGDGESRSGSRRPSGTVGLGEAVRHASYSAMDGGDAPRPPMHRPGPLFASPGRNGADAARTSLLAGGSAPAGGGDDAALSAELYRGLFGGATGADGGDGLLYAEEPLLAWEDLERLYPRYIDPAAVVLSPEERRQWIDLRPYCDPTPVTVHVHTPLSRVFKLFRGLGLRHLTVINSCRDVVGIVTRHELSDEALEERAVELGVRRRKRE